jgi:hypothetical protein
MQNFATTYSITMAVMALLLAFGLAAVGWNRYTPRTRKPIDPVQLQRIRLFCRFGSPALIVLALLYLASALFSSQA